MIVKVRMNVNLQMVLNRILLTAGRPTQALPFFKQLCYCVQQPLMHIMSHITGHIHYLNVKCVCANAIRIRLATFIIIVFVLLKRVFAHH